MVISKFGYKSSINSFGWQSNLYGYFGLPNKLFSTKLPPDHKVVAGNNCSTNWIQYGLILSTNSLESINVKGVNPPFVI